MQINWSDKYLLGIEDIDNQHKKLIEISERLNSLVELGDTVDKYDEIMAVFTELKDYTVYHFKFEEIKLASKGYEDLDAHKAEHDKFVDIVLGYERKMMENYEEDQQKMLQELINLVVTWILEHILGTDKKYVSILK